MRSTDWCHIKSEQRARVKKAGESLNDECFLPSKTLTIQLKFSSWENAKKLRAAISQRCHRRQSSSPYNSPTPTRKKNEQNSYKTEIKTSHSNGKKNREGRFCSWRKKYTQCKYVRQCKSATAPSLSISAAFPHSFLVIIRCSCASLDNEMAQKTIDKAKKLAWGCRMVLGGDDLKLVKFMWPSLRWTKWKCSKGGKSLSMD